MPSPPSPPSARVAELQRARLLKAAAVAFDELGYVGTSVSDVTTRARVSRRTFYEQFANSDECLAAVLDDAVASVEQDLAAVGAALAGRPWRERVRAGLLVILAFLDREPLLARVCVVETVRGGPPLMERRERVLARLAAVVDEARGERARSVSPSQLTAEGVVGAAVSIVQARIARREGRSLTELLNELMSMVVLPYRGPAAARRELGRPAPSVPDGAWRGERAADSLIPVTDDLLQGVQMRLTYRTIRVLDAVAGLEGRGVDPSNRMVADHAGIDDQGQISKLLNRLERLGLLVNMGRGRATGEPNAWALTATGRQIVAGVRVHTSTERGVAA